MKKIAFYLILVIFLAILLIPKFAASETEKSKLQKSIYIIPVEGTIDLGLSAFIKRVIMETKDKNAAAIIIKINTFGGRIDAADEIVTSIADLTPVPIYAYVTHSAWSAGALIAISCKNIIMHKGSSIGSAEPRFMGIASGQNATDEKIISALRGRFKATAEANNHSPNLAQAMVDKEIELIQVEYEDEILILTGQELAEDKSAHPKKKFKNEKVISPKNKLLNLTAEEAVRLKLAALIVDSEEEVLTYIKKHLQLESIKQPQIIKPEPSWSENLVRFLTHPIISSLLLSLGFLGILFELKIPGWGISGTLGALFLILFFWGHYLVGLADWVDIGVFLIGVIFLLIELFIVPGFGILGITGIIFIISGLVLTLLKHPFKFPSFEFGNALSTIAQAFVITFVLAIAGFKLVPHTTLWKRLTLQTDENKNLGFETKSLPENITVAKIGLSKTMLRPSGRATFENKTIDVTTLGEFIPKGKKIVIVKIEGNKVFVEQQRRT